MTLPGGPAPLDEKIVLSPEWLTAMLAEQYPGVVVTGTKVTERLQTVATKVRFDLELDAPIDGVPPALCAKGYFGPPDNPRLRGGTTEVAFYRLLASHLPVRTPPCIHAAIDDDTGHGLLVMEDLKVAGSTFLDPLTTYGPEQVARTLDQLAALHVATAEPKAGPGWEAFDPRLESLMGYMDTATLQGLMDDSRGDDLPDDVRRADRLLSAVAVIAAQSRTEPGCLVHGDVHTGNVYELADGSPGLIDWQVVQRGIWALDVAYHLGAVLEPELREQSERELVDHYLDRVAAHGGTPADRDEAWLLYRTHLTYGYFMWSITRAVDRRIIDRHTRRLGLAVAFHDSFGLLGA